MKFPKKRYSWNTQYDIFVKIVNDILSRTPYDFQHVSYSDFHYKIFKVFVLCKIGEQNILQNHCREYIKYIATKIDYPMLVILSHLLIYFKSQDHKLSVWIENRIHIAKKNSRTLMELCLNKIQSNEDVFKKYNTLSKEFRDDIQSRINNYYF